MAKIPIKVGNETLAAQEFVDGDERIIQIDDRFYKAWAVPNSDRFYFMVKIADHPRSIQGTHDQILDMMARVHRIYRDYEKRCRGSKEAASRERDRLLNDLTVKSP